LLQNGPLIITEEGFEEVRSAGEYEKLSIIRFLTFIAETATANPQSIQIISPEFIRNV
jgi:hypothetical protein